MSLHWSARAETKRQAVLDLIKKDWRLPTLPSREEQPDVTEYIHGFLNDDEKTITAADAVTIAAKVAKGDWTAVAVTEAFCHRAALAHQLLNCLHEIFFDAALEDAKALDRYYAEHNKTKGPLHGVPISLKDQFHVKDVETSMGYVGWIGTFEGKKDDARFKTFESEMVRELRELGAVLYCKTSVPHTLMSGETVNNIIGYTWNPKNRRLTAGGSSGGEGALISIHGSPMGLGTDIGGSIRIPAAFNGLYGIRPSAGRLAYEGMANSMDGQNSVLSVVGPIATTAASLRLMLQGLLSMKPWLHDPLVVEMPWRSAEEQAIRDLVKSSSGQKLAFGLITSDGVANPQPPVLRAVNMVAEALKKAGHEIVEWDTSTHQHGNELVFKSWRYDGGKDIYDAFALSGEDMAVQIQTIYGDKPGPIADACAIAENNVAKRQWQKTYMDMWNATVSQTGTGRPVDVIICPLAPFAAARPEKYTYYGYSSWVNGLDYTSVIVPVTNVDKAVDKYEEGYKALNDTDQSVFDVWDADIYHGAHVSVQIVGRRFTEERTLAVAEYIGSLVGK